MSFLKLRGVSKSYGRQQVLRDVHLDVAEGEFVAIVGYSGQGKTTLMSLIAGLTRPDEGEITLDRKPITEPGPDRGLVFQNYSLLPWLTVAQNIDLAVEAVFPAMSRAERAAHVDKYIGMVKLSHAKDRLPRQLSGGMRQRVSVARTLAIQPRILLLDEPLSALDALTRAKLQDEFAEIHRASGTTILLITNSVDEALLLADRIVPLTMGPGATLAEPVEVDLARPRDRVALNHDPKFKQLRAGITQTLLGFNSAQKSSVTRKLVLPDLLPEDLDQPRVNRPPRRLSEEKREVVSVN